MAVLNRKGTLRRGHVVPTLVSPWGKPLGSTTWEAIPSPDDFHVGGSAASTATDVRTCCSQARTELGVAPWQCVPNLFPLMTMLVSFPGKLADLVLCVAVWTSLLKQTSWSRLPVFLLPGWTHRDYLQHRIWALNQTRAAQYLFLGNWEPAWLKGSLAIVILYFHKLAPDFSKCALLDVYDSIPSPAVITANPLPLEMGQNLASAQAEVNPVSGSLCESESICLSIKVFPRNWTFFVVTEAEQDRSEEITPWYPV